MDVFISHSSKDASFVAALVRLLRLGLGLRAAQIRCTTIEETQFAQGADVDCSLRKEILESNSFIAILSPNSLHSTYVLFELGARWGAAKKMFPILVPGMTLEQIDGPISGLHVSECSRANLWDLLGQIGGTLGIQTENPQSLQRALDDVLGEQATPFEPLAFAVQSYVLDKKKNFALLKDAHYGKIQPPGRRLQAGEQPHEVALLIAGKELDLPIEELERFPSFREKRYKETRIIPSPFQVQLEKHLHRQALAHYDFVYVFTIDREKPGLDVGTAPERKRDPDWYSLREVESRQGDKRWGPHEDMVDTMRRILEEIECAKGCDSST